MIVGKNLLAVPRSPSPLLKKKLALRRLLFWKYLAIVREIVDFPVPALPFNQKIGLSYAEEAYSLIWERSSVRVPGRHSSSHWSTYESNAAS
jgi:hypothetical protein